MNVEIVEFYPLTRNDKKEILTGTLRIKLPDIGIHILGIYVSKKKGFWVFSMPSREVISHETGDKVRYPFVVFDDKEKQKLLMDAIRAKGRAFIERRLADKENPLTLPVQKRTTDSQFPPPQAQSPKGSDTPLPRSQKTNSEPPPAKMPTKVFVDLPPRKATGRRQTLVKKR